MKYQNQIVIAVPEDYASVKSSLRELANENRWTLSNYALKILAEHVKNQMSSRIPKTKDAFS